MLLCSLQQCCSSNSTAGLLFCRGLRSTARHGTARQTRAKKQQTAGQRLLRREGICNKTEARRGGKHFCCSLLCCAVLCCCYPSPAVLLWAAACSFWSAVKADQRAKKQQTAQQGAAVLFAQRVKAAASQAQHFPPLTAGESAQHFLLPPWNLKNCCQTARGCFAAVLCCAVLCCAVPCRKAAQQGVASIFCCEAAKDRNRRKLAAAVKDKQQSSRVKHSFIKQNF